MQTFISSMATITTMIVLCIFLIEEETEKSIEEVPSSTSIALKIREHVL